MDKEEQSGEPAASDQRPTYGSENQETFSQPPETGYSNSSESTAADVVTLTNRLGDSSSANTSKKRTLGLVLLAVSLLAFFIGGGAYTYLAVYVPNKPENVLKSALAQTFTESFASTATYKVDGEIAVVGAEDLGINSVKFDAILNSTDGTFDVHADIDATVTSIGVDARRPSESTQTYVRLTGLEGIDGLLAGFLGTGQDLSQSNEFSSFIQSLVSGINDQWFEIEDSLVDDATNGATTSIEGFSDEDIVTVKSAYENNSFLEVINEKQDEVINGTNSSQYEVGVNKASLESFLNEIKDANTANLKITDNEIQSILSQPLDETITVWIAKDSRQFTQIAFTTVQDGTSYAVRVALSTTADVSQITTPQNSKSILELISEISPLLGGQSQLAPGAEAPTDLELYQQCIEQQQFAASNGDRLVTPEQCGNILDPAL